MIGGAGFIYFVGACFDCEIAGYFMYIGIGGLVLGLGAISTFPVTIQVPDDLKRILGV